MSEVTHVDVRLDQPTLQTLRMGLSSLQLAATQADAYLNHAVQAALDAAKTPIIQPAPEPEVVPAKANGNGRDKATHGARE